jgi:hypothetical protein
MTSSIVDATGPYTLLRIGEAWRNRSGLITLVVAFVSSVLVSAVGTILTALGMVSVVLMGLFAFLGWLVLLSGLSAAGIQFMEQAAGKPVRGVISALTASPLIVLRSFGLSIVLGLVFLTFVLIASVVLFLCKIPGLGPLLLIIAVPVVTFVGALVFLGIYVAFSLAAPALWEGHSLGASLSQLWAVATQRPVEAFLNLMLLAVVIGILLGVLSGFLFAGFSTTALLSAWILGTGSGSGMPGLYGSLMGLGFSGNSSGLIIGGMLGGSVVMAAAGALIAAMVMLGLSLVYLRITTGIDTVAAQAAFDGALAKTREVAQHAAAEARHRAQEAQAAAQQRMDQARAAANAAAPTPAPRPGAQACPSCSAFVAPTDVFCGNCGHRLR